MKSMIRCSIILLLTLLPAFYGHQCDQSFVGYIQCMRNNVADKVNVLKSELEPSRQEKITDCFTASKCPAPQFSQATVDYFVTEPVWKERLNKLLGFVEGIDPRVSKCMVDHFVKVTLGSLEKCIHNNGVPDFQFPPINVDVKFKMEQLKQVVLNRMMVRTALKECCKIHPQGVESLLSCLQTAKSFNNGDVMCTARNNCLAQSITSEVCSKRLDDVLRATCSCLDNTVNKLKSMPVNNLAAGINQVLISGKVEEQLRQCHTKVGLPFPQDKLNSVKEAFKATVVDIILQRQVPDALKNAMRLLLDVFKDFGREWSGILCSQCSKQLNLDSEMKQLKAIVQEGNG